MLAFHSLCWLCSVSTMARWSQARTARRLLAGVVGLWLAGRCLLLVAEVKPWGGAAGPHLRGRSGLT